MLPQKLNYNVRSVTSFSNNASACTMFLHCSSRITTSLTESTWKSESVTCIYVEYECYSLSIPTSICYHQFKQAASMVMELRIQCFKIKQQQMKLSMIIHLKLHRFFSTISGFTRPIQRHAVYITFIPRQKNKLSLCTA